MRERKKVAVVFGTRPEAIKLAPITVAMGQDPRFDCRVCITAQHREMIDQVLQTFNIVPDTDLNLMQPNQSLAALTVCAITAIDNYLSQERNVSTTLRHSRSEFNVQLIG